LLLLNCRCLELIWFGGLVFHANGNDDIGDELLDILTKFSPNSLTKIYISSSWKYSIDALEQFFESCRERTLYRFGFTYSNNNCTTNDHKAVVAKYIREEVISSS
jgi:hypothetical protein